jgi:hypothetical protein
MFIMALDIGCGLECRTLKELALTERVLESIFLIVGSLTESETYLSI